MENGIEEILTEHNAQDQVETKVEELSDKTLAEVAYDHTNEEKKSEIQKEIEREAAENIAIPDPIIEEKEEEKIETNETVETESEEDVSEVVNEIMEEDDKDIQKKQWEELLTSLRDEVLKLQRVEKEKDIELKAQEKRIQELIEENKDLKYS